MYVIDTNIASEFSRARPHLGLLAWLDTIPKGSLALPFSVVVEIQRGISELALRKPGKAVDLQRWLQALLLSDARFLPMDVGTARILGVMSAEPMLRDLWVPDGNSKKPKLRQDLAIAATSIAYGLPVATRNEKDFLRIHEFFPLPGIVNPFRSRGVTQSQCCAGSYCEGPYCS